VSGELLICPTASVTFSVNLYVPAAVGIPLKKLDTPLLPGRIDIPGGRLDPGASDQVNGGTPPVKLLSSRPANGVPTAGQSVRDRPCSGLFTPTGNTLMEDVVR
jgi:hypothetical protein